MRRKKIDKDDHNIYLKCYECGRLNILPDLNSDYICVCGNKIVEHVCGAVNVKICNIKAKEIDFKRR